MSEIYPEHFFATLLNKDGKEDIKQNNENSNSSNGDALNDVDQSILEFFDDFITQHADKFKNSQEQKPEIKNKETIEKTQEKKIPLSKPENEKPKSGNLLDFQRRSIIFNNQEYILTTKLHDQNDSHYLIKPVFKFLNEQRLELIKSIFKNSTNIYIKQLTNKIIYVDNGYRSYIFYYVDQDFVKSNGFKDYFQYYIINDQIIKNEPSDLMSLLHVNNYVTAQPFYMFELDIKTYKEKNVYKYIVNDGVFDFITRTLSEQDRKLVMKEFIRKDSEYLLELAINHNSLQLALSNNKEMCLIL